jgi:hypothetical protein
MPEHLRRRLCVRRQSPIPLPEAQQVRAKFSLSAFDEILPEIRSLDFFKTRVKSASDSSIILCICL